MKEFEQTVKELAGVSIQAFRLVDNVYVPYQTSIAPLSVRCGATSPCACCSNGLPQIQLDTSFASLPGNSNIPTTLNNSNNSINILNSVPNTTPASKLTVSKSSSVLSNMVSALRHSGYSSSSLACDQLSPASAATTAATSTSSLMEGEVSHNMSLDGINITTMPPSQNIEVYTL